MFFCLCMSPAIDATVKLPSAPDGNGEVFKDIADEENVGGKGINVARWLALRGADVSCGGLLGEDNDKSFGRELAKWGIKDRFVRVPGPTRRNEMITWPGGSVKINRPAFPGLDAIPSALELQLSTMPTPVDSGSGVAILSGSLPKAATASFYAKAVTAFKSKDWTVVLDASGESMRLGLDAGPDLIKPNAEECEPLVGFVPKDPEGFLRATKLLRRKAGGVIISDGASGAWFDGEFVPAPKVDVVDATAAGDTLLAEYCWRTYGDGHGRDAEVDGIPAARWAVAAGSAACTMPGGAPPPLSLVNELFARIDVDGQRERDGNHDKKIQGAD